MSKNSWVIHDAIEQSIKNKVEKVGIPLKNWDVKINRGILTGFNDAFMISEKIKDLLISHSPKSAEIIRPIVRGRDIHKYKISWDKLYVIGTFPSLKIDIEKFPAIQNHFLSFGKERLKQTGELGARKRTNNQWFETQDSISYWEDFFKPKIIYPEITKFINFYLDNSQNFYVNNKCFILTGTHIEYLTAFLNSSLFKFCFLNNFPELLGGTRELRKIFLEKIPVKQITDAQNIVFSRRIESIQKLKILNENTEALEREIDKLIFDIYKLNIEERETIGFIKIK